jgi:hypothetical protein
MRKTSGGKSTEKSYLSKSEDTLTENDSSKSESYPVKYYLSKSLNVSDLNVLKYSGRKALNRHT